MTESWLRNGVCRCCHFEGVFTSLEDTFKAEPVDMTLGSLLKETLDVDITSVSGKLGTKLNTICDDCIPRLWDAAVFRKQILACEKKFNDFINNHTDSDMEMKQENKEEKWIIGYEDSNDEEEKTEDKYSDDVHFIHVTNEDDDDDEKSETKYNDDEKLDDQISQPVTDGDDDLQNCYEELDDDFQWPAEDDNENDDTKPPCLKQNMEYACTVSPINFPKDEKIEDPQEMHTGENTYVCGICKTGNSDVRQLAKHIVDEHMQGDKYPCTICKQVFGPIKSMTNHLKSHFEKDKFQCPVCNKIFRNKLYVKDHMKMHAGKKEYLCGTCDRSFLCEEKLKDHLFTHTASKRFMCHVCGQSFMHKHDMNKHMGVVHEPVNIYFCNICKKKYISKRTFQMHECKKKKSKHVCRYCEKDFSSTVALKIHTRSHTGEKPFLCTFCYKQFSQRIGLLLHERMHTGEKPYSCDVCAKRFINSGSLNLHKRVHTAERPYSCDNCERSFGRKGNLIRHIRLDKCSKMSVKYVTCDICKKQVSDLKKHMQLHYEDKLLRCTVCDKLFDSRQKLKRHMTVHTKDNVYS